ncbi:MAG: hypothetical protein AB1726_00795 [Planctomycetota bacterium]
MPSPDRLAKNLVERALELHRRRPWQDVPRDAPFLLRLAGEECPLAAIIIGQDASNYGLVLVRGETAVADVARWLMTEGEAEEEIDSVSMLSVTFEPLGELSAPFRAPLEAAGFRGRRERVAPFLVAKDPHRRGRAPHRSEMRLLLGALDVILAAGDAGVLRPLSLDSRQRSILEIAAGEPGGELQARTVSLPPDFEIPAELSPCTLPTSLATLPRRDERWLAAFSVLPVAVKDDDRVVRSLLLVDEGSARILFQRVLAGGDLPAAVAAIGAALAGEGLTGRPGLPREIVFTSRALFEAAWPALEELGVRASFAEDHPLLTEIVAGLERCLEAGPAEMPGDSAIPASLVEWEEAEQALHAALAAELEEQDLITPRALATYFGDRDTADEVLDGLPDSGVWPAFVEWFLADYRPSRRARTPLERMREREDLPPAARALIEARIAAELSIYRLDVLEPGATVEVEDILAGHRRTIHDRRLSGLDAEGIFLPLRLYEVGGFTRCLPAGPVLALDASEALAHLESLGAELTPAGLRRSAHLVGRLWPWTLARRQRRPRLQNTDGDPLEFQTASFRVANAAALRRALDARADFDWDEQAGAWIWFRPGPPAGTVGEKTLLARLELLGDELLVELNSARRLAAIRAWLEAIPGVRFVHSTPRPLDRAKLAPDDRLPGPPPAPVPPELLAQLEESFRARYRAWLDESIPALGHLTPRAAVRTAAGRARVARLIRTMPPIMHPGGTIPAPREFLFRELGLRG